METSNFFVCVPVERANDIELFFKVRHFKTSADARFHRKRGETIRRITVDSSGAYLGGVCVNKYELVVNDCIDKGNCLTNYIPVYQWWCYDKISNEIWEQFALSCLEELQAVSVAVARETAAPAFPDKIKIEIEF